MITKEKGTITLTGQSAKIFKRIMDHPDRLEIQRRDVVFDECQDAHEKLLSKIKEVKFSN